MKWLWIVIAIIVIVRLAMRFKLLPQKGKTGKEIKPVAPRWKKFYTVWTFFSINLRRLFRDRLALFFTFLFPLIFLFVFGSLNGHDNSVSFNVAIINESHSKLASQFVANAESNSQKILKVDKTANNFSDANQKMSRGELDATIELPPNFGNVKDGVPTGQAIVHYTNNNQSAAVTLVSVLTSQFQGISAKYVKTANPLTVVGRQNNEHALSAFDYTFTGLLGFSILGAGIFGPMNVFPELKKMGILRRLHTTPLRVWQYFLANMLGNAVTGLMSIAVMFVVAMLVFHLKIVGNVFELAVFLAYGIVVILGIGLALGGWARNERQAAPLGNIIVFPMMFLTGVFFPRFLMPHWLQGITSYMPLTPVIDGARMILTEGKGLLDLGSQLLVMTVWLIIVYVIAFRVFRWE